MARSRGATRLSTSGTGRLSPNAALNTDTGEVIGKTAERLTSAESIAFLSTVVASRPAGREIHIIADNPSAHKTKQVAAFLEAHPSVQIHFTPTYSSWLNQVELWFSKIARDLLARGILTSTTDLARKIRRYTDRYNRVAKPVRRTYFATPRGASRDTSGSVDTANWFS
ncbi:IS630 family transposase [Luteitalea pratensis]|uniref:IS630 family transposase n=1 Tax=Luteitalea pratensis TaxID=1855912 RepID=UPI000AD40557|nr:IS630 family transposase [Luteitalea pratensis]